MTGQTIAEKILSQHAHRVVRAGEVAVCDVDCVLGTDGSAPMAIDYFARMAGGSGRVRHPERVFVSLDHYAPPTTPETRAFHDVIRAFASAQGVTVSGVGDGISHQLAAERGIVRAGDLVVGADSHTVTCGALNCLAIGVGSSDLAAAMLTGQAWLRVPETIRVRLTGRFGAGVSAKDLGLFLVGELGGDGADYQAIEFTGDALDALTVDDRFVICNLMVEAGAKAAMFPFDARTAEYVAQQEHTAGAHTAGAHTAARADGAQRGEPVGADADARYVREIPVDLRTLTPRIALPHAPDRVAALDSVAGTAVQMVFAGTCTGGRVSDFHALRAAFDAAGGRVAPGVALVLTPASREVLDELTRDGTIAHLVGAGAELTTVGCGACCGTSGVIPSDGTTVLSTANRNFKARMGNASAQIFLASPAACGIAAAMGTIPSGAAVAGGRAP